MRIVVVISIICGICNFTFSQNFKAGVQYDTVHTVGSGGQSYALYLPLKYDETKTLWPILYIFEPAARGALATKIFKPLAEEYGYIIIASNNSRNGSWDVVFDAGDAIFKDSFERFRIDTSRIYLTGFSGGSRAAIAIASLTNKVAGVIGCGAGFSLVKDHQPTANNSFIYYGLVGNRDMNYLEMGQVKKSLNGLNIKNRIQVFDGPHRWPPTEELSYAFDWMEINGGNKDLEEPAKEKWSIRADSLYKAGAYLLYQSEIEDMGSLFSGDLAPSRTRLDSLMKTKKYKVAIKNNSKWQKREEELRNKYLGALVEMAYTKLSASDSSFSSLYWWRNEVKMLKNYTKSKDLDKSRMGSRVLNMIWASCAEGLWNYVQKKDMETAINLVDLWLIVNPKQIWPNWTAVRVYAINRDRKNTLKYIDKSIELGIVPSSIMLNDPNLDFVKDSKSYSSLKALTK